MLSSILPHIQITSRFFWFYQAQFYSLLGWVYFHLNLALGYGFNAQSGLFGTSTEWLRFQQGLTVTTSTPEWPLVSLVSSHPHSRWLLLGFVKSCSARVQPGSEALNPHRLLGNSLRAVPFSLVLCLTNASPLSSLELNLCLLSLRACKSTGSPHPATGTRSVAEAGGCWAHLTLFLSLKGDSHGLPAAQCLKRRALYILSSFIVGGEVKNQRSKVEIQAKCLYFSIFCDYFWGIDLFSSLLESRSTFGDALVSPPGLYPALLYSFMMKWL